MSELAESSTATDVISSCLVPVDDTKTFLLLVGFANSDKVERAKVILRIGITRNKGKPFKLLLIVIHLGQNHLEPCLINCFDEKPKNMERKI